MRNSLWLSALAVGALCATSSLSAQATTESAAAPAKTVSVSVPATLEGPCKDGGCKITIDIEPDILPDLNQKQVRFTAIKGCPKENGGETASALRAVKPLVSANVPVLNLPAFDDTKFVTVLYWFGAEPNRIAIVDFSKKKDVKIKSPWTQGGGSYIVDDMVSKQNDAEVRKCGK